MFGYFIRKYYEWQTLRVHRKVDRSLQKKTKVYDRRRPTSTRYKH